MAIIKNIGTKARHGGAAKQVDGVVVWPIRDITAMSASAWLSHFVKDKPYESLAVSIWTHQPNLRNATEKLCAHLTPLWPSPDGQSLLGVAIEKALSKVDLAVQRGENYHGRVVGIYLYWLASCVRDVARVKVSGYTKAGERVAWKYFSEPLVDWVRSNGIEHIEAEHVELEPTEEVTAGLRTHLIASITDHVDAGYLEMFAPRG